MKINFDMDLLRTLIAFADTGSFKGAAQLVSRTQPTISMQMKRLEEIVGHELFSKKGRDLVFNEKGYKLALQARQILNLHDQIVDEWHEQDVEGNVKLGIPDDYITLLLPHLLEKFAGKYSNASIEVVTRATPSLIELLNDGSIDMAVLATTSPEDGDVVLRREKVVWVTSPDYEAHKQSPLPLAIFSEESPVFIATLGALQQFAASNNQPFKYRICVTSQSWAVLKTVATEGYAVTTMAECVVPSGLRVLTEQDGFPDMGYITLVLRGTPDSQSIATSHIAQKILEFFRTSVPSRDGLSSDS